MKLISVLGAALWLSGCATVMRGTTQDFEVVTQPPGATVTTTLRDNSGVERGCRPTPCRIEVPRRSEFIARIDHEGYQSLRIAVRSTSDREAVSLNSVGVTGGGGAAILAEAGVGLSALGTIGTAYVLGSGALVVGSPLMFVDASTGALSTVTPNPVNVSLVPLADGVERVRFVDPQALPDAVEVRAIATAGQIEHETLSQAQRDELDEIDVELAALQARYDAQCKVKGMRVSRPEATQGACRTLRAERRALRLRRAETGSAAPTGR